jgi:lysyl-tRNA synthetase, class II
MSDTLQQLRQVRLEKTDKLRDLGVNPYPYTFDRTHTTAEIQEQADTLIAEDAEFAVAGRLMAIRAGFSDLQDADGRIQMYVHKKVVDEQAMLVYKLLDIGDIVGVKGVLFRTRTEALAIKVTELTLLCKAIRPLPVVKSTAEKTFDAVTDKDFRYRRRYVDLTISPESREVFVKRSKIVSAMRRFLEERGYLEVETPTLQPIYGGASARPFTTHHNALDMKLYMRIATELYLKRLIVGGFEGVFEIGKNFRNEGIDRFHNPEFTVMELYVAYHDYHWMMSLVEEMFHYIAMEVVGTAKIPWQGQEIDLSPPWKRISMFDAIKEFSGHDLSEMDDAQARAAAKDIGLEVEDWWDRGKVVDEIFGEKVEPNLIQPTFVIDHPVEISPLAKIHRDKPGVVERFEPVIGGKEIGNAFSELSDPVDQRQRFEGQMDMRAKGDPEAQMMDEDYVMALEYGMPPTTGLGIGIDRLAMLLTDASNIRDIVLFPQMRADAGSKTDAGDDAK